MLNKLCRQLVEGGWMGHKAGIPALFGTVIMGLVGFVQLSKLLDRRRRARTLSKKTRIELLPVERSIICNMSPPISSVTYFKGNVAHVEKYFAERVTAIVAANPWLVSVLDRDLESNVVGAYYSSEGLPELSTYFSVRRDILVSRSRTPYLKMVRILSPVLCKRAFETVGKEETSFKVALIPDAEDPEGRFALIVSASHILMDGHGYGKLYNMLSSDVTEIESLNPIRKPDVHEKIVKEAFCNVPDMSMSPEPFSIAWHVITHIWDALFPLTQFYLFRVSNDWVNSGKALVKEEREENGVDFVSTNDLLVSAFFNLSKPRFAVSTINFRGRIKGCEENDVGNYEGIMDYFAESDWKTPAMIRKSVSGQNGQYMRAGKPRSSKLKNVQFLGAPWSIVTNNSTFTRTLCVEGATQDLFLFLVEDSLVSAYSESAMVIMRVDDGPLACMVATSPAVLNRIKASGMVQEELDVVIR
jgi:hypothetical protein